MEAPASGAWAALGQAMSEAERLVTAAAPDAGDRVEGLGYLARLFASTLETGFSPQERTVGGLYYGWMKLGGYNPDYVMGRAPLDPKGAYRLAGCANDAARFAIGVYTASGAGLDLDGYVTAGELDLDGDGRFALQIGASLGGRNALALKPTSNLLITRALMLRPEGRRPEVALTRLDGALPAPSPEPLTSAAADAKLTTAANQALMNLRRFLHWSEVIASRPNEMTPLAEELDQAVRGDPDTRYYSGYFDLEADQALVIELPAIACPYRAIQALNHWLEPIPGANLHHANWRPEADRTVRIVAARRDPGMANWLDVGGRRRGALLYRTVGADIAIVPKARLTTFSPERSL